MASPLSRLVGLRLPLAFGLLLLAIGTAPAAALGQLTEPEAGVQDLGLLLRQLDSDRRVLMVAAHPDDEDTALLAQLARGMGVETAYLSLTRGEGGQNLIGPELNEGLGLIRTGELLSARSLDGARQYFSRAFDFGFSKTAEETLRAWPEDEILSDIVRVIRSFRPQVLITVFQGTPDDGHGHHQAAGILARRAFALAGEPGRFPELDSEGLAPWAPTKLYRLIWRPEGEEGMRIETGALDPLLGRSHHQVAMASRSRHRSQDMGAAQDPGPRTSRVELLEGRGFGTGDPQAPLLAGVATGLLELAEAAGGGMAISRSLQHYSAEVAAARRALDPERLGAVLPALEGAWIELQGSMEEARRSADASSEGEARARWQEVELALEAQEDRLARALAVAAGLVLDVRVDRTLVTPGSTLQGEVLVWNGGEAEVRVEGLGLELPEGWILTDENESEFAFVLSSGTMERRAFRIRVPEDAALSVPYFLRLPREGSVYRWPDGDPARTLPGDLPVVQARLSVAVGEASFAMVREATHLQVDKALGELRLPLHVAPALSVTMEREAMAWPAADTEGRRITVEVENLSERDQSGRVELELPPGWNAEPVTHPLDLAPGASGLFPFEIRPDAPLSEASAGEQVVVQARAHGGGESWSEAFRRIDYPHIDPLPMPSPARLAISRFPVTIPEGLRVGYLMGPGDGGFEALNDLGIEAVLLDPSTFRGADLSTFTTLVLGARAYETREDLAPANPRILDFVENGGTVVVQYNKYEYPEAEVAPYPVAMRRPHHRVTDPAAAVTFLEPGHPLLQGPNPIAERDFERWVQERGLYFLSEWDSAYSPLLEMADPREEPTRGALVVARYGQGAYIYTGLALFRQWPRGVPGSFRLLVNLVALRGGALASP